jgi:hypothetical protein
VLIERYVTTIPIDQRTGVIADIVHRVTEDAIWLTLFFDSEPSWPTLSSIWGE